MIATMITIEDGGPGRTSRHGVSRRGLLKIGALGAGGMALTNLLRAAARSGEGHNVPFRRPFGTVLASDGESHFQRHRGTGR